MRIIHQENYVTILNISFHAKVFEI